jgi:hypothetical protein
MKKNKPVYIPSKVESALAAGEKIATIGSGIKMVTPRLMHRPNLCRYVQSEGLVFKDGKITITDPKYVNPQKSEISILGASYRALFERLPAEEITGVTGEINTEPVFEIEDCTTTETVQEQFISGPCYFRTHGCTFAKPDCICFFRPHQVIRWIQGDFWTPLAYGEWIDIFALKELVKKKIPYTVWDSFISRNSSKYEQNTPEQREAAAAWKLYNNIQTMQRVYGFDSLNCYGLPLYQMEMRIDSGWTKEKIPVLRLVLGDSGPLIIRKNEPSFIDLDYEVTIPSVSLEIDEASNILEDV